MKKRLSFAGIQWFLTQHLLSQHLLWEHVDSFFQSQASKTNSLNPNVLKLRLRKKSFQKVVILFSFKLSIVTCTLI